MEETNKKYTAKDFARYHSGTMAADEMHALEKAALEDPFLADALEGYANTGNFETDILELKERVEEKRKKKNVFTISSITENKWWRIAALFVIISGAGFFFYRLNFVNKGDSLATTEIKSAKEKTGSTALSPSMDSATANGDLAFQKPEASTFSKKDNSALSKQNIENEKADNNPSAVTQPVEAAPLKKSEKDLAANNISENAEDKFSDKEEGKEYRLKGRITDDKGNPIAMASISEPTRKEIVLTDTAGNFLLRSPDSNTTATVTAAGYSTKKVTLQKDEQPTIAMNKSEAAMSEVVVTGLGQKNKKDRALLRSKALSGKVSEVEITTSPQPFPKNDQFEQYMDNNIKPVLDENGQVAKGEVLLSFTINKKGRPSNIKIIKSSCAVCEKLAIALLEDGPDWNFINNREGTTVINFK